MSKRVYKFTSARHGISSLQNKRLKLSTIDDLNDPFDLCPMDITDPVISTALDAVITDFRRRRQSCASAAIGTIFCFGVTTGILTPESVWVLIFPIAPSARTTIPMSSINRIFSKYAAGKT
jgi:hypothetical protein